MELPTPGEKQKPNHENDSLVHQGLLPYPMQCKVPVTNTAKSRSGHIDPTCPLFSSYFLRAVICALISASRRFGASAFAICSLTAVAIFSSEFKLPSG